MDNWSVYVHVPFDYVHVPFDYAQGTAWDFAQPSGDRIQSFSDRSLSVVEGNALGKNNLDERQK